MLFITRTRLRVTLLEQKLLTLPEQLSSPSFFTGVRVAQSLVYCVILTIVCLFVLFRLVIVLSVLDLWCLETCLSNLENYRNEGGIKGIQ